MIKRKGRLSLLRYIQYQITKCISSSTLRVKPLDQNVYIVWAITAIKLLRMLFARMRMLEGIFSKTDQQ